MRSLCDDAGVDADDAAELRSLRARAYGPGPGIHDDPAALRRLAELEERNRPTPAVGSREDAERPGSGAGEADARGSGAGDADVPGEGSDGADGDRAESGEDLADVGAPPRAGRRLRVWVPAVWVASLLVVAALVGAWTLTTTLTVFTPIQREGVGRQVAVLSVDPDFRSPPIFGQDEVAQIGFHDFYGLTAIATNATWMGGPADPEGRCLFVMRTDAIDDDAQSFSGPIFNDCTAGSFPAVIEVGVNGQLPAAIRERFPDGSGLQFVLDGDRVGVFTDAD